MSPDNNDRAGWAEEAVGYFAKIVGATGEDRRTQFQDLLNDMLHLADRWELDIEDVIAGARAMYQTEVDEDGGKALPAGSLALQAIQAATTTVVEKGTEP